MKALLTLALASVLTGFALAQTADEAKEAMKKVSALRQELFEEGRASGKPLSATEIQTRVNARLEEVLAPIDATKIEPKHSLEWARVYQTAGRHKTACELAQRFLETDPTEKDRFQAMYIMATSCNEQGEAEMLAMTLEQIPIPDAQSSVTLAGRTAGSFVDTIYEKKGLTSALAALKSVESRLVQEDPTAYAERSLKSMKERAGTKPLAKPDEEMLKDLQTSGAQANENQRLLFFTKRAELIKKSGDKSAAADILRKGMESLNPEWPAHRRAKSILTQMELDAKPAPLIARERGYGEFPGLDGLKGKVVIVDFFAHWCGPCIASFPEMKKMYEELKDKGLEIVGVTTYYGYYKRENVEKRDMDKDTEFAKMSDFLSEHKLPWPVVYGDRKNFEAYGVTGIPTTALIDREGNIRKIHVGYSAASFKEFREEVEKLLAGQ